MARTAERPIEDVGSPTPTPFVEEVKGPTAKVARPVAGRARLGDPPVLQAMEGNFALHLWDIKLSTQPQFGRVERITKYGAIISDFYLI